MSAKQPFLPLFFGDFLASTAEWSGEEQSLYLLLLGHQWSLGSIPADVEKVRKLARWERKTFAAAWPTVAEKFPELDGRRKNDRLEHHRANANDIAERRTAAGRNGAAARWQKDGKRIANALPEHQQTDGNGNGFATNLPCHPNHTKPREEEEKNDTAPRGGVGESSLIKPLSPPDPKSLLKKLPLAPPQEGHDARSFDDIKANVGALAERLNTQDPHVIHRMAGQSHKLSKRQCEEAVKQLREDGFFARLHVEPVSEVAGNRA